MNAGLRVFVRNRANRRCEYCHLSEEHEPFIAFHVEHIVAIQHHGDDDPSNLCLACASCNLHKGPNLSGRIAATGEIVQLFHPRRDIWEEHFEWAGPLLIGLTPVGEATIAVLGINLPENIDHRKELIAEGVFPINHDT
ncbi:MAG: HNH endonuclease [Planctomycetales bacterium]